MARRKLDAVDALRLSIARERGADRFYRQAAENTKDSDGKKMFEWLAKEERRHLGKLRQQLSSLVGAQKWVEWRSTIPPLTGAEFPSRSEASGTVRTDASERDALEKGIESERDAVAFYKEAQDSTPDLHGKEMFKALAREEEGHLALLEEELEWLSKFRKYFTVHRFELRPPG